MRRIVLPKVPDWIRAAIVAFALLGIATVVLFRLHMKGLGEDAELEWTFGLWPGCVVFLSADTLGIKSHASYVGVALWLLVLAVSYLWYFGISYTAIMLYRRVLRLLK